MNALKKYLGLVWMILAPVIIFFLVSGAVENIDTQGKKDINNPIIWIIIIGIFTPIAIGLFIFGWYGWKGMYENDD
jgi:hypothetical protein